MRRLASLLCGVLFGLGLAVADMTSPTRVLAFLDVTGAWDPSLLFVLGGAVCVTSVAFHFILPRPRPLLDAAFHLPTATRPDAALVIGALLFGVGWGIAGYCPGPGVALLAVPGNPETPLFLGGLVAGTLVAWRIQRTARPRG